ncbi:hypothetical protein [Tenggerimyces flavus]|uniref:Uncharacterized protein n=1 Tax=Tenggerimyces flavus TaxID=1708749 RepID=A0ABV7YPA2_9ACTN|nr:hypothetical protein [Tenggerimyces flavus]MBM7786474.1 hypothetical protein [Tenggerimyces flavus]
MTTVAEGRSKPYLLSLLVNSGEPRPVASYGTDLVTSLLGVWFAVGLFVDAWAHTNIPQLETFFTPWHAVFYSGFTATALWILWVVWRNVQAGRRGLAAVPQGYGLSLIALPVFAAMGVGDFLWHTLIGIEQNLTILFSPTHLGLITSMVVILTGPLRSAWADVTSTPPTFRRLLPATLGLAFSASLVLLFVLYSNAWTWYPNGIVEAFSKSEGYSDVPPNAGDIAASITITNVVMLAPLLLLARRWRVPPGTATVIAIATVGVSGATTAGGNVAILAAGILAGVVVDLLLLWLRPIASRRAAYFGFAFLAGFLTWAIYLAAASLQAGRLPAIPEYWTGAPIVAGLHGLLLALLFVPSLSTKNSVLAK